MARSGAARLNGFNGMTRHAAADHPVVGGDIVLFPDVQLYYVMLGAAGRWSISACGCW